MAAKRKAPSLPLEEEFSTEDKQYIKDSLTALGLSVKGKVTELDARLTAHLEATRVRLLQVEKQLNSTFVQREEAIRVILLGVLSRNNYLFIGDPGTAKTSVIDCFTRHIKMPARFKILMGAFTEPADVFGPLDIAAFKQGVRKVVTAGMMPEAPLPILDETLKASDGCMNSLLGVLGPEREFMGQRTDIICTGGATNWPEVNQLRPNVEALYDRFLLRCIVEGVDREDKEARLKLYRAAAAVRDYKPVDFITPRELRIVHDDVLGVEIDDEVVAVLDNVVKRLATGSKREGNSSAVEKVSVSDRRSTQLVVALQANAWLAGRPEVGVVDFDILKHGLWAKRTDMDNVRAVLETIDSVAIKEIADLADEGRGAYRQVQATNFPVAKVNEVMMKIQDITRKVDKRLKTPVFTQKGRKKVMRIMQDVGKDFKALKKRADSQAGKSR